MRGTRNACYHHNIKEPTKVIELDPQEQNSCNTNFNQTRNNVYYSNHIRNKVCSNSSIDHHITDDGYATYSNPYYYDTNEGYDTVVTRSIGDNANLHVSNGKVGYNLRLEYEFQKPYI